MPWGDDGSQMIRVIDKIIVIVKNVLRRWFMAETATERAEPDITEPTADIPDWQRQELEKRLAEHRADPDEGDSWDQVRERLRKEL